MRGIKVNYTDVRISAMEDFVGRGDRRLAPVVKRAWELGAGMDSWWENLDKAYGAWSQAIAEADLTWKYRQVENGEWNIFGDRLLPHSSKGDSLKDSLRIARIAPTDALLPWDHINTGIDKDSGSKKISNGL